MLNIEENWKVGGGIKDYFILSLTGIREGVVWYYVGYLLDGFIKI